LVHAACRTVSCDDTAHMACHLCSTRSFEYRGLRPACGVFATQEHSKQTYSDAAPHDIASIKKPQPLLQQVAGYCWLARETAGVRQQYALTVMLRQSCMSILYQPPFDLQLQAVASQPCIITFPAHTAHQCCNTITPIIVSAAAHSFPLLLIMQLTPPPCHTSAHALTPCTWRQLQTAWLLTWHTARHSPSGAQCNSQSRNSPCGSSHK
jgi:hypothetical protein